MQTIAHNLTAVIYTRVSTDKQVGNASLETQEKACRAFCAQNGWEPLRLFREEGESAKTADRPQLLAAIDFCHQMKPSPDFFVVYAVDRLARNAEDHLGIRARLSRVGTKLRSVTQALGEDPAEKFTETILAGAAEFDNALRAQKTVAGMKTRLSQGQRVWKAPIGYLNTQDGLGQKTMIPDPERAPLVQKAFELFATGLHSKTDALKKVTELGLRTKSGRRLTLQDFKRLLSNPVYKGLVSVKCWNIESKGNFEPLVCEETFDEVQAILAGRKRGYVQRIQHNPDFPLRHFLKCGSCGRALTASWSKGRSRKYGYYHCQNRKCVSPVNESKQSVESQFLALLQSLQPKSELIRLFKKIVSGVWEEKRIEAIAEYAVFERQMKELKERKNKLFELFYGGAVGIDEFGERKAAIEQELILTGSRADDSRLKEEDLEGLLTFAESVLLDPASFWLGCSIDQKQRLQQILFPDGLQFADGSYRTASTCLLFSLLQTIEVEKLELVALTGIEPVF